MGLEQPNYGALLVPHAVDTQVRQRPRVLSDQIYLMIISLTRFRELS